MTVVYCLFLYFRMEEYEKSPWSVECLEEFLYYCCPECDHREHSKDFFIQHAFGQHPDAEKALLLLTDGINIKIETSDIIENDIPEINNPKNYEIDLKCEQDIDNQESTSLRCPKPNCYFEIKTKRALTKHMNSHKDCMHCGKSFVGHNSARDLKNHINLHFKPKTICNFCGKDFKFSSKLMPHIKTCNKKYDTIFKVQSGYNMENEKNNHLKIENTKSVISDVTDTLGANIQCKNEDISIANNLNQVKISDMIKQLKKENSQSFIKEDIDNLETNFKCHNREIAMTNNSNQENISDIVKIEIPYPPSVTNNLDKIPEINPFQCKQCQKSFASFRGLQNHIDMEHDKEIHKCEQCDKIIIGKGKFLSHIRKVHEKDKELHKCEQCNKVIVGKVKMLRHIKKVHESLKNHEKNECEKCNKVFAERNKLIRHIENFHDVVCQLCGKKYATKRSLDLHIKYFHEGQPIEKNHICEICAKPFKFAAEVRNHIKYVHEGKEKPHKCELCDYSCVSNSILQIHISSVHKGLKNFECEQCGKLFVVRSGLRNHIKMVHEKRRDFKCDDCGKMFQDKHYLKHHIETVHEGKRKYSCEDCGKTFAHLEGMKCHIKTIHEGIRYQCDHCERSFTQKPHLKSHMKEAHSSETFLI